MRFSETAHNYLKNQSRDPEFALPDRQAVIGYLTANNVPILEKIIDFQMEFSGLELTVAGQPNASFKAALFSKTDILENRPIEAINLNGQWYLVCGSHATAQFWFVVGSEGQIGTYDSHDETVNTIASSFETFVESYALKDALANNNAWEHPFFYDVLDPQGLEALCRNYIHYPYASDAYTKWMSDGNLFVHQGTWFDRPAFFLHAYGEDKKQCETFVQKLINDRIIA